MTLFLIALHFWKHTIKLLIIDSISLNVICWKQTAMKLVRCVCDCVWIYLHCAVWSCWVKNIHHSFVDWTGIERSCPQLLSSPRRIGFGAVVRRKPTVARRVSGEKAPEAKRRCTRRRGAATSRLWSFWSPEAPRWTPRATVARASIREAGARNRVSNLGHFKIWQKCFRAWNYCIFSKCLAKSWLCTPNVGISDHK